MELVANKAASSVEMFPIVPQAVYAGGYLNPLILPWWHSSLCGFLAVTLWEKKTTRGK
jgi:hypothetical protein